MIFLHHGAIANNSANETISAGLGPTGQYGIILAVLIFIVIIYFIKKNKKFKTL